MTDKKMTSFELGSLNYFLTRAFLVGIIFNLLLQITKQDSWIIPIIGIIPAIGFILILNHIINFRDDLNIADKILYIFNKNIAIIILIILIICSFILSIINNLSLNNFIQSQFLNKTPILAISIIFSLATYYIVNKGINVISRTSNILIYIELLLTILSFLGLLPSIKIDNLKPFFIYPPKNYFTGLGVYYTFSIIPIFFLTIIPKNRIKNPKIKKTLTISYIFSSISIFLIIFQTIATFGYELSSLYEYPEFFALKHIILIEISSRIESILSIQFILDMFIFNIFITYFIGKIIKSIFKFKKMNLVYFLICLIVSIITNIASKYNASLYTFIYDLIPITICFLITFTIIIVCIKIKMSKT